MKNTTHTTDYMKALQVILEAKPTDLKNELRNLAWGYSGDENRFIRQTIINELTGTKTILAKCGVNALAQVTHDYLKMLEQAVIAKHDAEQEGIKGIDYPMDEEPNEIQAEAIGIMQEEAELAGEVTKSADIEAKAITKAVVGMAVIRKQCQRKGSVTAVDGMKVTVTLEDGSVRRPCASRFLKLYNAA